MNFAKSYNIGIQHWLIWSERMTKCNFRHLGSALSGVVLMALSGSVLADWNFVDTNVSIDNNIKATAAAYYVSNSVNGSGVVTGITGNFQTATLGYNGNSGLGVYSPNSANVTESGSPYHAIDNKDRTDMIMFSFTNVAGNANIAVDLNSVKIGWQGNEAGQTPDADISVLRYKNAALPTVSGGYTIAGRSWAQLQTDGWELVGSYADLKTNVLTGVAPGSATSSWWIVSAYNSGFSGSAATGALSNGNDFFKLVSVSTSKVPEPGSLALVGMAFAGLLGARRRGRKAR